MRPSAFASCIARFSTSASAGSDARSFVVVGLSLMPGTMAPLSAASIGANFKRTHYRKVVSGTTQTWLRTEWSTPRTRGGP